MLYFLQGLRLLLELQSVYFLYIFLAHSAPDIFYCAHNFFSDFFNCCVAVFITSFPYFILEFEAIDRNPYPFTHTLSTCVTHWRSFLWRSYRSCIYSIFYSLKFTMICKRNLSTHLNFLINIAANGFIPRSYAKLMFGTNVFENSKFSLIVIGGKNTSFFILFLWLYAS